MKDFLISYTNTDRPWAEWISWVLEENDCDVEASVWQADDTVTQVWQQSAEFERGIVLLSKSYLEMINAAPEKGVVDDLHRLIRDRQLIPIRVEECSPPEWLVAIAYLDLVDTSEPEAEQAILQVLQERYEGDRISVEDVSTAIEQTIHVDGSSNQQLKQRRQPHTVQFFVEPLNQDLGIEMVQIPAGTFLMGSPEDELEQLKSESPQHEVSVATFFMGKYPVTQAQWRAVAELPQIEREMKADPSSFKGDMRPVEQVSWYDAAEFCARLSQHTGREYRLPTEAEWEYACRAETTTPFYFGETITTDLANYRGTDDESLNWSGSYGRGPKGEYRAETTPVEHFGVANGFGLCDMHGNVWEWCKDHSHDNYQNAPMDGSAWLSDDDKAKRIIRGGSWFGTPRNCRSACRYGDAPDVAFYSFGFRVVCSAPRTLASHR